MRNPIFVLFVLSAAAAIAASQPDPGYDYFGRVRDNTQIVTNAERAVEAALATKADATNTYTKAETDAAIARLAPTPGDYLAVSNAAMNAVQPNASIDGWVQYYSDQATNSYSVDIGNNKGFSVEISRMSPDLEYLDFSLSLDGGANLYHNIGPLNDEDLEIANGLYKTGLKVTTWAHGGFLSASYTALGIVSPYYDYREAKYKYPLLRFPLGKSGTFAVTADIPTDKINQTVDQLSEARREIASIITTNTKQDAELANIGNHLPRLQLQLDAATATNAAQSAALESQASQLSQQSQSISTLGSQVSAIGSYLNAEDARFVSTNYDSVVRTPEAYVEVRLNDNGTNGWTTIWREMTRWGKFVGNAFDWDTWVGFHAWATNVTAELSHKADRCWGIYDSETGGYSPEGYTQISSSNILIAAGMAYQRTVTTGGNVWVLQCNQGTAHIGGDTNGFFRVVDGDGVTQFEIIKGDRREMGADASGITVSAGNVMTILYSVEAAEHPTISCCNNLSTANWTDETDADCLCTVSWSGTSGAWVATVTPKTSQPSMFIKATFMAGGETYIRNVAPVGMDSIMLNGTKYYLGTATISGHTVLTLSTTPPSP